MIKLFDVSGITCSDKHIFHNKLVDILDEKLSDTDCIVHEDDDDKKIKDVDDCDIYSKELSFFDALSCYVEDYREDIVTQVIRQFIFN